MNISEIKQIKFLDNLNLFLISILPIGLIIGSLISNILVISIVLLFFFTLILKDETHILKNKFLIYSFLIYVYLIFTSLINIDNFDKLDQESTIRSIGFIRFVLLSIAICYYIKKFGNEKILILSSLFFLFVTVDLIFESYFGSNLLGFKSEYYGRLSGLTGEELKIGGFYFGFILLSLSFLYKKKPHFIIPLTILFVIISIMIGERSNFLKILFCVTLWSFLTNKNDLRKKLLFFLFIIFTAIISLTLLANTEQIGKTKGRFLQQIFQNQPDKSIFENIKKSSPHYSHYVTSVKIFKDYPIFGVGLKKFRKVSYQENYNDLKHGFYGRGNHPHQFHFEWLAETGVIGYTALLFFFLYYIFYGLKEYIKTKNIFLLSSLLFLISSLLPFLPSGSFFTSYGATIFWINFGFFLGNSKVISFK